MSKLTSSNSETLWRCNDCGYESRKKTNTLEHVEAKHIQSSGFLCSLCQHFCLNKKALRNHTFRHHRSWFQFAHFCYVKLWNKWWRLYLCLLLIIPVCRRWQWYDRGSGGIQIAEDTRWRPRMHRLPVYLKASQLCQNSYWIKTLKHRRLWLSRVWKKCPN